MTHPFLDAARALAVKAAARLMELRLTPLVKEHKADHSLVTNADHEADLIIRQGLRAAFPDHAILTEESGLDGDRRSEFVWLVDPLDGTKAYVNGSAGFSVMIGLLKQGKPFVGLIVDPVEGRSYEAVRGEGAYIRALTPTLSRLPAGEGEAEPRVRAHVSRRAKLEEMPVITSTGFPSALEEPIRKELKGPWMPAVNSVGIKVGLLASQVVDIYINHRRVHYWDTCAPMAILREAGGLMTFLNGESLVYRLEEGAYRHEGPTLATNDTRHQDILSILRSIKPPLG